MTPFLMRGMGSMALILMVAATHAQEASENRVGVHTAWNVFVDENPARCWVVAVPEETASTRDGRAVAVKRSEIMMFVTYDPASGSEPTPSLTGGYPYADGSTVEVAIGETTFQFLTLEDDDPATPWAEDEHAWPDPSEDSKILLAMKRGVSAVVTGRSARGTVTKDTFSLYGFTAALEDAEKRCNG